jgi:hypothetical protein
MNTADHQIALLSTLVQLEQSARQAETEAALGFVMTNETLRLVPYRQAFFWTFSPGGKLRIRSVSGTDQPAADAPLILHLTAILSKLQRSAHTENGRKTVGISETEAAEMGGLDSRMAAHWQQWSLANALWCPLITPDDVLAGGLFLCRDTPFSDGERLLLKRLQEAYAHALWAVRRHRGAAGRRLLTSLRSRTFKMVAAAVILGAMFLPVRLSVLAPVEIVPLDPTIVAAPMDGVVRELHVDPNQQVTAGDLLFSLEDTELRNHYQVAEKALEVARAEYMKAAQKSFVDMESRGTVQLLKAEVDLKTAEMAYARDILQRSRIKADRGGIAVYSNREDWLGKPVAVGERVMTIADPLRIEAEILLPVADAINLEAGAEVAVFLNTEPGRPLRARLHRADYEAMVTPAGDLAFRLRASLDDPRHPRIGLRGTAKIYGIRVTLFYYLLRRPMTAVRMALGL